MSILIKNMEMPSEGTFNIVHIYSDGRVAIPFWEKGMQVVQGIEAVPVPPHGRLIDADALRQTMYHEAFETDSPLQKWDSGCWIRYKMFERMEETAPTIIPAEPPKEES